jgi:hypothetical protein
MGGDDEIGPKDVVLALGTLFYYYFEFFCTNSCIFRFYISFESTRRVLMGSNDGLGPKRPLTTTMTTTNTVPSPCSVFYYILF